MIFLPPSNLNSSIDKIVNPYSFSLFKWEVRALSYELEKLVFGTDDAADKSSVVLDYFSLVQQTENLEWQIMTVKDDTGTDLLSLGVKLDELGSRGMIYRVKQRGY